MAEMDESVVTFIATTIYNINPSEGSIKRLNGYDDKNYSFEDSSDGRKYVLKIVNELDSDPSLTEVIDEILDSSQEYSSRYPDLEFTTAKLIRTSANKLSTHVNIRNQETDDDTKTQLCNVKLFEHFNGISVEEFVNKCRPLYEPAELYFRLGRLCGQLFKYLVTQRHLKDKLRELRNHYSFPWQLMKSDSIIEKLVKKYYPDELDKRRQLVDKVLTEFRQHIGRFNELTEFVVHSDLSENNILVDLADTTRSICIIDFGDVQVGPEIVELSVMMLYNVLAQERVEFVEAIKLIPKWTYQGYRSATNQALPPGELALVPILMKLRLCQSLMNGQAAFERDQSNEYVFMTNKRGWLLLELLVSHPDYCDNDKLIEFWRKN